MRSKFYHECPENHDFSASSFPWYEIYSIGNFDRNAVFNTSSCGYSDVKNFLGEVEVKNGRYILKGIEFSGNAE